MKMEINENTTLDNLSESIWVKMPGIFIDKIFLEDGRELKETFPEGKDYSDYDFEFQIK